MIVVLSVGQFFGQTLCIVLRNVFLTVLAMTMMMIIVMMILMVIVMIMITYG